MFVLIKLKKRHKCKVDLLVLHFKLQFDNYLSIGLSCSKFRKTKAFFFLASIFNLHNLLSMSIVYAARAWDERIAGWITTKSAHLWLMSRRRQLKVDFTLPPLSICLPLRLSVCLSVSRSGSVVFCGFVFRYRWVGGRIRLSVCVWGYASASTCTYVCVPSFWQWSTCCKSTCICVRLCVCVTY